MDTKSPKTEGLKIGLPPNPPKNKIGLLLEVARFSNLVSLVILYPSRDLARFFSCFSNLRTKAPKAHRKSKMQIFMSSSHPLNGAGHTGPGLRPDFWQVEKHDVKASAMPSLKCSLCAEVLSAVRAMFVDVQFEQSPAVAPVHSEPKIAKMGSGPRARMASAV